MDAFEATRILMYRIQTLDPENASKIMGVILIQDKGEKEMTRLALGSDALLLSCINHAKAILGLVPSPATTLSTNSRLFSHTPPRVSIPDTAFHLNPSSPAASVTRSSPRPISYAAVVNGSNASATDVSGSTSLNLYCGNDSGEEVFSNGGIVAQHQVQEHLFLDDSMADPVMSPSGRSDSLVYPYGEDINCIPSPNSHPFHRRSCSVNDASFVANLDEGGGGSGFGVRPCMYFARGFCKNGSACKFIHSDVGTGEEAGSPCQNLYGFEELLRMKVLQQRKLALLASGGHRPVAFNKCMNFTNDNHRSASAAAALMMGDEFYKYNRCRHERSEFSTMGMSDGSSSISRQIYLTFPADSSFNEEDVSNYFSTFGPVQDVRIPHQPKRMFGFVTFVYPETVKIILAKGNPHFVCNSRVLVKPYKEKGKVFDKKYLHMETGEYEACLSPSELDSRDYFDIPYGPRMLLNSQETMLRRKLEQEVELQKALELHGRREMNIQLKDLQYMKNLMPNMLSGLSISPPRLSQSQINSNIEVSEEFESGYESPASHVPIDNLKLAYFGNGINKEPIKDHFESLEYSLPDNLFSSPTKFSAEEHLIDADDSVHSPPKRVY